VSRRTRSCEKKTAYLTREAANAARLDRVATGTIPADLLHVYRCSFGDHFHLGHKSRRYRQQGRRAG
jgi:hypothetical protein